jgi:hypothetical protein
VRKRYAFTLLEALVTCFLISLIFTAAMLLINKSAEVIRFFNGHVNALSASETGLERMVSEAREGIHISLPAAGASSPGVADLQFLKVNPAQQSVRLPNPLPIPLPASWNPDDPNQELSVHYHLESPTQTLLRDVAPGAGGATILSLPISTGVTAFGCYWQNGSLMINLTVQVGETSRSLSAQVVCPVQR